jgi:hypothetical protein
MILQLPEGRMAFGDRQEALAAALQTSSTELSELVDSYFATPSFDNTFIRRPDLVSYLLQLADVSASRICLYQLKRVRECLNLPKDAVARIPNLTRSVIIFSDAIAFAVRPIVGVLTHSNFPAIEVSSRDSQSGRN